MRGLSYKWIVATVVIFGVFMVLLDTTIVNIAVPRLQTTFGAALTDVSWVSTGYTLAEGIGIPLMPFFSALMGNKRFYIIILILFTIGSALCGLAWSLPVLIIFRILQGFAGASMLPLSITLLYSEFPPEERGIALGALGFPLMVAPALGPSVGGYIVTFVDWRVLFYINVPIGIAGCIMAFLFLRDIRPERNRPISFDVPGFLFSSIGLGSLLYGLDKAGSDGWSSLTVLGSIAVGLIALVIFVFVELITIENGKQPLLDLRIFGSRTFAGGNIAMMTLVFALFGGQFLTPLYLQNLRGLSAYDAGLVLLPQALGSMVASLFGGRLVDKLGVKAVVIPGLLILGSALWGFSRLTLTTPLGDFQILLIIRGLGLGFAMQPTTVAALAEIKPAQLSQASSLNSVVRSMTSALAVALVSTLVTDRTTFHYVRLSEQVTPDSAAGQGLQQQAAYLMGQNMTQQNALLVAMEQQVQQMQQQAYLLAMNDTFLLTLAVTVLAVLVVLFVIRVPRKSGVSASKDPELMAIEAEHMSEHKEESKILTASKASVAEPVAVTHQSGKAAVATLNKEQIVVSHSNGSKEQIAVSHANGSKEQIVVSHSNGSKERIIVSHSNGSKERITVSHQGSAPLRERRKDTRMRRFARPSVIIPAIVLAVILVGGVVGYLIYNNYNFYSTDDAQVTGTMVNIVPPTTGTLINLDVQVGSEVSAKQIIGTIEPLSSLAPVQHLIAPTTGLIVAVPGVVGQLMSTTSTVAQETDPGTIKVTAYVDESAIKNVMVGQAVDIHVDAYNSTVTGHVSQIVGATAGQFSLLPTTDNSSGNYTKVSQRVPVDVQLDDAADGSLLPGMSVEVTIHLH
jgi:EmrB/QacA subfamily drug resistance transporter